MRTFNILITGICLTLFASCTDLSETLFDQVGSDNYYNTQMDIIRAVYRPFEHAYWSVQSRQVIQELSADQIAAWKKDDWWEDGGRWSRLHYHTWTIEEEQFKTEWEACFKGIMQCNYVMDDLDRLNPADFNLSDSDFAALTCQCRTMRAWFYLRLLDEFRNVPLAVSSDVTKNSESNVSPQELFSFIESELTDCVDKLPVKTGVAGNGVNQGQWNKASAAALLVRLYLNSEIYIGQAKFNECAQIARKIIAGEYGAYSLEKTWDKVFDWDNDNSPEIIFGFPSAKGYNHYVYAGDTFWWTVPARQVSYYFDDMEATSLNGDHNCKYRLAPSLSPDGKPYNTSLGCTVAKFKKYPKDYRLLKYRNLGNSTREGMMLFGYLEYMNGGSLQRVASPEGGYDLYLRDAVASFKNTAPDESPADLTSDMFHGDHSSGWAYV
ncbi:MAG: RagB/SusD family nutrient uptake outer membrane protein, partial [Anaerovoracaceae bacterium]